MERYFGEKVPKLGFGLMRLPKLPGDKIDIEQTKKMETPPQRQRRRDRLCLW